LSYRNTTNNTDRINKILKMPETRVPMTLRDSFLQDDFFKSAWEDMETFRSNFFKNSSSSTKMIENNNNVEHKSVSKFDDDLSGWMKPRKWMLPSLKDDKFFSSFSDNGVINMTEDDSKMEISLNTSGYSPSELKVNVADDVLIIEGKHEEKTQEGHTMVSRQFRRQYGLSSDVKKTEVVSNLSQDGVLVVTLPKEKRFKEITKEEKGAKESQKIEVEKSSQKVERERKASSSASSTTASSSASQKVERERKSSASSTSSEKKASASMVPMNLRDSFFDDPFFQDNWIDIKQSQKDFFSKAQEEFQKQMQSMESRMESFGSNMESSMKSAFDTSKAFDFDKDFKMQSLNLKDEHEMKIVSDNEKLEISLDTAGYKPDELKVTAGQGVVCIEAKHEERTQAGEVMVSRHMKRSYPLPSNSKPEEVVSNLSKDGVLIVTVPKMQSIKQEDRNVPIQRKN